MTSHPIKHCYWVVPGKFLAGEYTGDVDETASRQKINALLAAGIRAFIDLTTEMDGLEPCRTRRVKMVQAVRFVMAGLKYCEVREFHSKWSCRVAVALTSATQPVD